MSLNYDCSQLWLTIFVKSLTFDKHAYRWSCNAFNSELVAKFMLEIDANCRNISLWFTAHTLMQGSRSIATRIKNNFPNIFECLDSTSRAEAKNQWQCYVILVVMHVVSTSLKESPMLTMWLLISVNSFNKHAWRSSRIFNPEICAKFILEFDTHCQYICLWFNSAYTTTRIA